MSVKRASISSVNDSPVEKRKNWEVFYIHKILDRRINVNGEYEYYVKWMYHSNLANSWEPRENILCKQMLDEFEAAYEKKQMAMIDKFNKNKQNQRNVMKKSCRAIFKDEKNFKPKEPKVPFIPVNPKIYGVERGEKVREICYLFRQLQIGTKRNVFAPVGQVIYKSGTMDVVPVKMLRAKAAKIWNEFAKNNPGALKKVGIQQAVSWVELGYKIDSIGLWTMNATGEVFFRVKYSDYEETEMVACSKVEKFAPAVFNEYKELFEAVHVMSKFCGQFLVDKKALPIVDFSNIDLDDVISNGVEEGVSEENQELIIDQEIISSQVLKVDPVTRVLRGFMSPAELRQTISGEGILNFGNSTVQQRKRRSIIEKAEKEILSNLRFRHDYYGKFVTKAGERVDLCDCLDLACCGCWFPCKRCKSRKCGVRCRNNRDALIAYSVKSSIEKTKLVRMNPLFEFQSEDPKAE